MHLNFLKAVSSQREPLLRHTVLALVVACQEVQHASSTQVARRVKVEQPPTELVTVKRVKGYNNDDASKVASGEPI